MYRSVKRFSRRVVFLVFGLIGSGFCLPAGAWTAEKVRVGLSVRSVVFLPFYYAKDKKVFQKNGLDVEIIQMRSDLQTVGLVSGELDFNPAIGPAILAISNGMPLRAVAVFYRAPLLSLVSPGHVLNPKDLEGKKVAVSRIGSESHRYGVLMLQNSGVDAKRVTFIQTGSTTVSLTALQQGSVEAAVLSPPFTGVMARQGFRILMRSRDLIEAPWLGVVTSQQKVQRQPERVRSLLKAMKETLKAIRQDRRAVTGYIQQVWKVDPEVAEEAYEDINGVIIDDMFMPEERLKSYLDHAHRRGELSKMLAVGEVIDYSFLKSLQ